MAADTSRDFVPWRFLDAGQLSLCGQLARMSKQAKEVLEVDELEAIADRGCFDRQEILACEEAGIAVTLPKPMTSATFTCPRHRR